jgi:hypothetical protein
MGDMKSDLLISEVGYPLESSDTPGNKRKREDRPNGSDSVGA